MGLWCGMTQEDGQSLADLVAAYRPFVNSTVKVMFRGAPKKHQGKVGRVTWHGLDQFSRDAWRYGDSYSHALREVRGRYGYRVGIETEAGERFFVPADSVMVAVDRVPY